MKRIFVALGALLLCGQAPAEWTFFGMTRMEGVQSHNFFLASTLVRTGDLIQVRTKSLPTQEINMAKLPKEAYARNAARAGSGYHPPFSRVQPLSPSEELVTMAWEVNARDGGIAPVAQILWEIDCGKKTMRSLEVTSTRRTDKEPTEWQPVLAGSVGDNLMRLTCL